MADEPQAPSQGNETPPVETPPVAPVVPPETPPVEVPPNTEVTPPQTEAPPSDTESEQPRAVERIVPAADGYQFDEGTPAQLGEIFSKLDMTQEQAAGIIKLDQVRNEAQAQQLLVAGQAHIKEWGDSADTNLNLARRGRDLIDPTGELKKILNESGSGNDPRLLEMFYQFGQRMEEGGFLPSAVNTPGTPKTAAQTLYGDQGK